jgi:hypothetical protein
MKRDALRRFLRQVALCSPLLLQGCDCVTPESVEQVQPAFLDDAGVCDPVLSCPLRSCGTPVDYCTAQQSDMGLTALCHHPAVHKQCSNMLCTGRRPAGLEPARAAARDVLGAHFAEAAHLEAASVLAFERLAAELSGFGAPAELIARARRSARDEARHARAMTALAARHGATPPAVVAAPPEARALEAMAIENAVEGCVHETYGAAVAVWQARRARDQAVRGAMRAIARDEASHAELAWAIAAWASRRLDAQGRARVAEARSHALRTLASQLDREPPRPLSERAGVPTAAEARGLFALAADTVWKRTCKPPANG